MISLSNAYFSALLVLLNAMISAGSENRPPNFLVIVADDLGFSDLGCYGSEIATPNLDRLAENGLRLTHFYNTGRCWPTRSSLLSGYYPQQIRRDIVPDLKSGNQGVRPKWATLLPVHLRSLGYRNYHSGKWHIDGNPLANGFDHSFEIGGGQNNFFSVKGITIDGKQIEPRDDFYVTTGAADHAIDCLQSHARDHSDKPFFQYLAFTAPHFPLHARQDDIDRYRDTYKSGWESIRKKRFEKQLRLQLHRSNSDPSTASNWEPKELSSVERELGPPYNFPDAFEKLGASEVNRPLPWDKMSEEQCSFQATKMAIHAAMVDRMDRDIGRVLEQLKGMNSYEDTIVIFVSDNGASAEIMVRGDGHEPKAPMGSASTYLCLGPGWATVSNTPFRRHKTWNHEGGIRTPMIVHWPAGLKKTGIDYSTLGHVMDIAPTLWDVASRGKPYPLAENAPKLPSHSLASVLDGTKQTLGRDCLWWIHESNRALRIEDWKIVASGEKSSWELYNLADDRAESKNLAQEQPQRLQAMVARWESLRDQYFADAKRDE